MRSCSETMSGGMRNSCSVMTNLFLFGSINKKLWEIKVVKYLSGSSKFDFKCYPKRYELLSCKEKIFNKTSQKSNNSGG